MTLLVLLQQPSGKLPGGGQLADCFSLSDCDGQEGEEVLREKMRGGGSGEHQGSQGFS